MWHVRWRATSSSSRQNGVPVVVAVHPRCSVRLAGDVALPRRSRRWRGRTVMGCSGVGGGGDEVEVVDDGGWEWKDLFVYDVYVSFRQTALTRLSVKESGRFVIYYVKFYLMLCHSPFIYKTSFRPVPMAWHLLTLGHSFGTDHSSPGASPLDPLVHIFNPSSCTHLSSQSSMLHLWVLLLFAFTSETVTW